MSLSIITPGNKEETLDFAARNWIELGKKAIEKDGEFNVALSGGSTPKAIFQRFKKTDLDWSKVQIYFSDERVVDMKDPQSNFKMAWDAGFKNLVKGIQINAMYKGGDITQAATKYEEALPSHFNLIMLGMGGDGHIASLFPYTHALNAEGRFVVANYLPEKEVWRLTFTYEAIQETDTVNLYVLGKDKAEIIKKVLTGPVDPVQYPVQKLFNLNVPVNLILDRDAASLLNS